jgi:hypothetical protein
VLVRGRDEHLAPVALQEIFRQAASEPQIFEAIPLAEIRDLQMWPLLAAVRAAGASGVAREPVRNTARRRRVSAG